MLREISIMQLYCQLDYDRYLLFNLIIEFLLEDLLDYKVPSNNINVTYLRDKKRINKTSQD